MTLTHGAENRLFYFYTYIYNIYIHIIHIFYTFIHIIHIFIIHIFLLILDL